MTWNIITLTCPYQEALDTNTHPSTRSPSFRWAVLGLGLIALSAFLI